MSLRPIIAIDMDEVLCYFVKNLALFANKRYNTSLTDKDYFSYYFFKCQKTVHDFFESEYFEDLPEVPHAREVLERLSKDFDLMVITSRQSFLEQQTLKWLDTHLPNMFKYKILCNHFNSTGPKLVKSDICKQYGASVMIDDNVQYIQQCSEVVPYPIFFGDYAWNQVDKDMHLNDNIKHCYSWLEIEEYINTVVRPALFKE